MDNSIRNYIFDFGNVLVRFDPKAMTAACVSDPKIVDIIYPVVFDRLYWDPLDYGGITDEELKTACRARLPQALHALSDMVYDRWLENLPFIDGMQELLTDIKAQGGKLYLLSNISIGFAEQYHQVPHLKAFFSQFDGLVFSGPLGIIKPQKEIFCHLLDSYGLDAQQCIFIDDSAKNIAGAQNAGIQGYLFDGDAEKLRAALSL